MSGPAGSAAAAPAVRGSARDAAFWDGVREDRQRGNFLGASIKAAPQRRGAGDPQWYLRGPGAGAGAPLSPADELALVRQREREQLESRLGLRPAAPREGEARGEAGRVPRRDRDRDQIVPQVLRAHALSATDAPPPPLLPEDDALAPRRASKRPRRDDDARSRGSASSGRSRSSSSSASSASSRGSSSKERRRRRKQQKRADKKECKRAKKAEKKAKRLRRSGSPRR
jgi:hypothetical protein